MNKKIRLLTILSIVLLFFFNCKTENSPTLPKKPILSKIEPSWLLSRTSSSIKIIGENFNENCKIVADNSYLPTEFISTTELKATVNKELTQLPLDFPAKNINIRVKDTTNPDSKSESGKLPLKIYHIPQCNTPKLILNGEGIIKRENFSLLNYDKNIIIVIWVEKSSENNKFYKKFIISKDCGSSWSKPKNTSGEFFTDGENFYRIDNGKIYISNDYGENWDNIGEKPKFNPSSDETLLNYYLKWSGDSNLYCIFSTQTPSKILRIYTFKSHDLGESWEFRSKSTFDISNIYEGEELIPSGIFLNNNNGLRIEFITWFGRNTVGVAFVSSDGGLHYTLTYGDFSNYSNAYLLDNNALIGVYQEYYTGAIIGEWFSYWKELGTKYLYGSDLWELFSKRDESMPSLNIKMSERLFINLKDKMICSYDKGKNWSAPASFLNPPDNLLIIPYITKDGNCFTLILSQKNEVYFSSSLKK